jgi:ankyrin repeat protein
VSRKKKNPSKAEIKGEIDAILRHARAIPRFRARREADALIDAVRCNKTKLAFQLLARGVDANSCDRKGRSALWHAARWVRADLIRELVRRKANLPDDVLLHPVDAMAVETVRFLVRKGANVNCVANDTQYKFPKKLILLDIALRVGHPDEEEEAIPLMLIKAGAKVDGLATTQPEYADYCLTMLGLAAERGHVKVLRAMLEAGADIEAGDTWGGTPLFHAAEWGHAATVEVLLAAGAKVNVKRRDGATPASIARQNGHIELAEKLEKLSHAANA